MNSHIIFFRYTKWQRKLASSDARRAPRRVTGYAKRSKRPGLINIFFFLSATRLHITGLKWRVHSAVAERNETSRGSDKTSGAAQRGISVSANTTRVRDVCMYTFIRLYVYVHAYEGGGAAVHVH